MNIKNYVLGTLFVIACVFVLFEFQGMDDDHEMSGEPMTSGGSLAESGISANEDLPVAPSTEDTNSDTQSQEKRISFRFVDENKNDVPVVRVIGRSVGDSKAQKSFHKVNEPWWQGKLIPGDWILHVRRAGQNRWHKERIIVVGDMKREIELASEMRKVVFLLRDPDGNPVVAPCTITSKKWNSSLRTLTGMSSWTAALPVGSEDTFDQDAVVLLGPRITLSLQLGSKYFMTFRTRRGLFAAQWIFPPLDVSQPKIVVVLRKSERRHYRIVSRLDLTKDYLVQLVSDQTWTRSDWTTSVDRRGEFYVDDFRPFMGGNYAFLRSADLGRSSLPVGIAELPGFDKLAWQDGTTVDVDFGELESLAWTWVGKPESGAKLVFQLTHPRDKGEQVNIGAEVGSIDWAQRVDLPNWVSARRMQCFLIRSKGPQTMVKFSNELRHFGVMNGDKLRLKFIDRHGQAISGVHVGLRPQVVAATASPKRLQSSFSESDGACEIAISSKTSDAILEVRHPDFQYSEFKVNEMASGDEVKVTLSPLQNRQLSFRWTHDSELPINGSVQIRSKSSSTYRKRNGVRLEEVRNGQSLVALTSGTGKYSIKLLIDDLSMEFRKNVDLNGANPDLVISAPVRSEISVSPANLGLGNLVIVIQYTDELGWRQKSFAEIKSGVAVVYGPANPSEIVSVQVRMRSTNSTLADMKFSRAIFQKRMTFGKLLQGIEVPQMTGGSVTFVTGSKDAQISIRSRVAATLKNLASNRRHEVVLPIGRRWEARVLGSVPFEVTAGSHIDASSVVGIDEIHLEPSIDKLVGERSFLINIASRFYETLEFQMTPSKMRLLDGSRCLGILRCEGRFESIPFVGVVHGNVLKIRLRGG